jgi:hypothetical protein
MLSILLISLLVFAVGGFVAFLIKKVYKYLFKKQDQPKTMEQEAQLAEKELNETFQEEEIINELHSPKLLSLNIIEESKESLKVTHDSIVTDLDQMDYYKSVDSDAETVFTTFDSFSDLETLQSPRVTLRKSSKQVTFSNPINLMDSPKPKVNEDKLIEFIATAETIDSSVNTSPKESPENSPKFKIVHQKTQAFTSEMKTTVNPLTQDASCGWKCGSFSKITNFNKAEPKNKLKK